MAGDNMLKASLVIVVFVSSLGFLGACGGGGTPPPDGPTISMTASLNSISLGQTLTLTWSTTNATSCIASADPAENDWSGNHSTSGSQSVTPSSTGTINYSLTCTGAGGNGTGGASVAVAAATAKATHFMVTGPANVDSGIRFSLTVSALDSFNNTVTTYSGTIHFTSTDPHAQLPPDSTLASGTGVFSAALAIPGGQQITGSDTATTSLTGTSGSINVGTQSFPVELFGTKGDGQTDDTAAVQGAIDAAGRAGGGSVLFRVARYFTTGTLQVPTGVVLCGTVEGPFDVAGVNPATVAIAPTLLITNSSGPL
jgi:polygalacturonase